MCKIKVTTSAIFALLLLCCASPLRAQSEQRVNVANNETTAKLLKELGAP